MKTLVLYPLALLATIAHAAALDEAEIKKLLDAPHSRDGLIEELQIFPDAREFKVNVQVTIKDGEEQKPTESAAKAKFVDGKYFVVSYRLEVVKKNFHSVVTFDKESGVYRRWLLPEGDEPIESIGTSTEGSRSIAWRVLTKIGEGDGGPLVTIEHFAEGGIAWTELMKLDDGKLLIVEGKATPAKKEEPAAP